MKLDRQPEKGLAMPREALQPQLAGHAEHSPHMSGSRSSTMNNFNKSFIVRQQQLSVN